jgi:hypothetical protein
LICFPVVEQSAKIKLFHRKKSQFNQIYQSANKRNF